MKKIRKFSFLTFGLLMICLTLVLVSHNVKVNLQTPDKNQNVSTTNVRPDARTCDDYSAGLLIEYTTKAAFEFDENVEYIQDLSDVDGSSGERTFYITFSFIPQNGISGFQFNYDLSSLINDSNVSYKIINMINGTAINGNRDYFNASQRNQYKTFAPDAFFGTFQDCYLDETELVFNASGSTSDRIKYSDVEREVGYLEEDYEVTIFGGPKIVACKLEVTIPSTYTSIDIPCSKMIPGYGDDNSFSTGDAPISEREILKNFDATFPVASSTPPRTATTNVTGTWTGNHSGAQTVNLNVSGSNITATIPAACAATSLTIKLNPDEGFGSTKISASGWSADSTTTDKNDYIVSSIPAPGSSSSVTVTVYAGDHVEPDASAGIAGNVHKMDYTLKLERRSSDLDLSSIKVTPKKGSTAGTQIPLSESASGSKTFIISSPLDYDVNSLDISATLTDSSTSKLYIGGSGSSYEATSGGTKNVSLPAPSASAITGATIPVIVECEDGTKITYNIQYSRNAAYSGLDIHGVNVATNSAMSSGAFTIISPTSGYTYKISGNVPYSVSDLYFTVRLKDTDGQSIEYAGTTGWNGVSSKSHTTITSGTSYIVFKVYDQTGASREYKIEYTKVAPSTDTSLSVVVTDAANPANVIPMSSSKPATGGSNKTEYHYQVNDTTSVSNVNFKFTGHTVEFNDNGSATYSAWTAANEADAFDIGSYTAHKIYYVKVTAEDTSKEHYYEIHVFYKDTRSNVTTLKKLEVKINGVTVTGYTSSALTDPFPFVADTAPNTYYFSVPYTATSIDISYEATAATAKGVFKTNTSTSASLNAIQSINPATDLSVGTAATYNYYVCAETGTWGSSYKLVFIKQNGDEKAYLENVEVDGTPYSVSTTATSTPYVIVVPYLTSSDGTGTTTLTYTYYGVSCDKTSGTAIAISNAGKTVHEITVKSETGKSNKYIFHIYAAQKGVDLLDIQLLDYKSSFSGGSFVSAVEQKDVDGNYYDFTSHVAGSTKTITLPYDCEAIYLLASGSGAYNHAIYKNATKYEFAPGETKTITIYGISHYASVNPSAETEANQKTASYTFKITRKNPSSENRIASLTVVAGSTTIGSSDVHFDKDTGLGKVFNFPAATENTVTFKMSLVDPVYSKLYDFETGTEITKNGDGVYVVTKSITFATGETSKEFKFKCVPETGEADGKLYTFTVTTEDSTPESMPVIEKISIKGAVTGTEYVTSFTIGSGVVPNPIALDKSETSVVVSVETNTGSGYKIDYVEVGDPTVHTVLNSATVLTKVGTTTVSVYAYKSDGTTDVPYEITLTRDPYSTVNTISSVDINGETIDPSTGDYIYLPSGTSTGSISLGLDDPDSTASVKVGSGTPSTLTGGTGSITGLVPGLNTVTVTVKPEDPTGTTGTYTVVVYVDYPKEFETLTVTKMDGTDIPLSPTYSTTNVEYSCNISFDLDYVKVNYTFPSSVKANELHVTCATEPLFPVVDVTGSTKTITIEVNGESGVSPKIYKITFNKATANPNKELLTVQVETPDMDGDGAVDVYDVPGFIPSTTTGYYLILPLGTSSYKFINVTHNGKKVTVDPNTSLTNNSSNMRTIVVEAEDGSHETYEFNLIVADTECSITSVKILDAAGNEVKNVSGNKFTFEPTNTDPVTFTIPYSVSGVTVEVEYYITATLKYNNAVIGGSGYASKSIIFADGVHNYPVNLTAYSQLYMIDSGLTEAKKSPDYQINIVRDTLDTENRLEYLKVFVDSVDLLDGIFDKDSERTTYELGNISAASIRIEAKALSSKASIITPAIGNSIVEVITLDTILSSSEIATIKVIVKAEDPSKAPKEYEIIVSRDKIDPETDKTVMDIVITDNNGKNDYLDFKEEVQEQTTVTIPVGVSSFTIEMFKPDGSLAKLFIDSATAGNLSNTGTLLVNVNSSNWGKTLIYYAYAISQSGESSIKYKLSIVIEEPSNDATLLSINVDGSALDLTQPSPYTLEVPFETVKVNITAKTNHEKANIVVNSVSHGKIYSDDHDLNVGLNTIVINVTAEDGITFKEYVININKAPKKPELLSLEVNGEQLKDKDLKNIVFDPKINDYFVVVPFEKTKVEIIATASEGVVTGIGEKDINVGTQTFNVTVTNSKNVTNTYKVNVRRLDESYANAYADITIQEIPEFNSKFDPYNPTGKPDGYSYSVPNKIKDLNVDVKLHFVDDNTHDTIDAKYEIYGDENLRVGINNVVVIVTSADGTNQTTYVVQVERLPKQYEVNNKDAAVQEFTIEAVKDENNVESKTEFKVNIGKKKTSEVDFEKFIENLNPENQQLTVTILSNLEDNPDEVIIMVSDGTDVDYIKFNIESTGNPGDFAGEEWVFIGILGIILIVLTAILISVNRDKYGKITKKTNKKNEKKENKEEAKRK